jgi:hypothetical protein
VSTLATLESGGVVETLGGAFPPQYQPGIRGVLVGPSAERVRELRELVVG